MSRRRLLVAIALVLLCVATAWAAVTLGTNAGFVTAAPTADPAATGGALDTYAYAQKLTVPADAATVTEIGWYCAYGTDATQWDGGMYTHNTGSNCPNSLLAGGAANVSKTGGAGWQTAATNIDVSSYQGGTLWVAVQVDDTALETGVDYDTNAGEKADRKGSQTALPASWGTSTGTYGRVYAIYAKYTTGGGTPAPAVPAHLWIDSQGVVQ